MTKLAASSVRSPIRSRHLSNEDRRTYRQWARRVSATYFAIILALAISISMRDRRENQLANQGGAVAVAAACVPSASKGFASLVTCTATNADNVTDK
jgi:hypothetical protein